jgi:hypothetical protein
MLICGKGAVVEGKLTRIARLDAEGYDFVDNLEAALRDIRESGDRIDMFTFTQKLSSLKPEYAYPMEWDNLAALEVSTVDHWMAHQVDFKVRNKVRKASKNGVVVREAEFNQNFIKGISAIYNEVPVRQGKPFWHYGKDLATVEKMNCTFMDRSIFLGAFFEDVLIGFVKLVTSEDRTQAGLMQIVSMVQYRDKAPTNALVAAAVKSCAERKIRYLWYANFSYGNKKNDSLADFKRHNGFQKVDVPRYYVPLTAAGQIALRLKLYRDRTFWIPEPMAATYRKVRSAWYDKKAKSVQST